MHKQESLTSLGGSKKKKPSLYQKERTSLVARSRPFPRPKTMSALSKNGKASQIRHYRR